MTNWGIFLRKRELTTYKIMSALETDPGKYQPEDYYDKI